MFTLHRCEIAAGQVIDKEDGIDTAGFYIELGTAQVLRIYQLFSYLAF